MKELIIQYPIPFIAILITVVLAIGVVAGWWKKSERPDCLCALGLDMPHLVCRYRPRNHNGKETEVNEATAMGYVLICATCCTWLLDGTGLRLVYRAQEMMSEGAALALLVLTVIGLLAWYARKGRG